MLGWLLGLDSATRIERIEYLLASSWARQGPFWLFLAVISVVVGAVVYYRRFQHRGSVLSRTLLGFVRGLLLALLIVTLAEPFIRVTVQRLAVPTVYLLFDGTESMLTEDVTEGDLSPQLAIESTISRLEAVKRLLRGDFDSSFTELARANCQIEAYLFDGRTTSHLRKLAVATEPSAARLSDVADQLVAEGQVTALSTVLADLAQDSTQQHAAAVVMFSDFCHNSGAVPTTGRSTEVLHSIGLPTYTVGVGKERLTDLAVDLQVEPRMKNGERGELVVMLQPSSLAGRTAEVSLFARAPEQPRNGEPDADELVGVRTMLLANDVIEVPFAFTPSQTGLWEFRATAEMIEGDVSVENNEAVRQVTVMDDYLRLLYVAYEPNWEWRFVKEALHRDPLVVMDGFRTFLESSDPRVRRNNVLFLESLPARKAELFTYDVVLIDDLPSSSLTPEFCEMLEEYVGQLGGGLVLLAGPRFTVGALADTTLAEMLPVFVDDSAVSQDGEGFKPSVTRQAIQFSFMSLADAASTNDEAWSNLDSLQWYQPVAGVHEQAFVLCEHPVDLCADGKTKQPLIAIRRYGKGEVVFLAFNELWRLRRGHGETFHRRFWSQLTYRLGMSHAIGDQKRFVARTDRTEYRVDDLVTLTVDAYDADYEPLGERAIPGGSLTAELTPPQTEPESTSARQLVVPWLRSGVFETRFAVAKSGRYLVRVDDPTTGERRELRFDVSGETAERRNPVRNVQIQQQLADLTGGKAYELAAAKQLIDELPLDPVVEQAVHTRPLWNTALWFLVVAAVMIGEWLARRWIHLK